MNSVNIKIFSLKKILVYLFVFIFSSIISIGLFEFMNFYSNIERHYKGNYFYFKGKISYYETVMDTILPVSVTEKKEISIAAFAKKNYNEFFKLALGNSSAQFSYYDENEEETQQNYNNNEKKLYKIYKVDEKNKTSVSASAEEKTNNIKDINTNEDISKNKNKEKVINDDNNNLNNKIKAVHSGSNTATKKIGFYKEDENIKGNPNDEVNKKLNTNLQKDKPQILIFHTHNRESYAKSAKYNIPYTDNARTTDNRYNVVRVGEELTQGLREKGFNVIHFTGDNEGEQGTKGAYLRAGNTINAILKKYPSIQVILDIHRDAAYDSDKDVYYKFVTNANNKETAQVMIDVSSDYYRFENDPPANWRNWHDNLKFGAKLQNEMSLLYPGIMRNMCISKYTYNQNLRPNAITLEIGSNANTLDEALNAADCLSNGLAELLKN